MFREILFWKNWNPLFKSIYFILLFLFLAAIIFFGYSQYLGHENIIPWQTINLINKQTYPILEINKGIFSIPIQNHAYYIIQSFKASPLLVNTNAINILFIISMVSYVFLFSIITYFKGWWYYIANSLIILSIAGARLDLFMVYGDLHGIFTIAVLSSSLLASIVFHFIRPNTKFIVRLITYICLFSIYVFIIFNGSIVANPQIYFIGYGLFTPICLSIVFIILVSFDVEYIFLYLTTSTKSINPRSNTKNLLLISLIYISNITFTLLYRLRVIDWDLYYFPEYLMLGLSTIAGFWVYKRRLEATGNVIPYEPFGAIFYLLLATITWSFIGYIHASGNYSLIRSIKEIILYSHFGIGLMFVIYVLYTYTVELNKNQPVYLVVLNTSRGPIHYIRLGGFIIMFGLISTNYYVAWDYLFAGYYSNVADIYINEQNHPMAAQYYQEVSKFKPFDFKRTLGIAAIAESYDKIDDAISYYNDLHSSFDCEQSYINESYLYDKQGNTLKALGVLKDGLAKYPESSKILLNIGNIFHKIKFADSALYYFEMAEKDKSTKEIAQTNKLALFIATGTDAPNNLLQNATTHLGLNSNIIAYQNIKQINNEDNYKNELINEEGFWMYHINFLANKIHDIKDTSKIIKNTYYLIKNDTANTNEEALKYASILSNIANGNIDKASEDLYYLKNKYSENASEYLNLLGILSLNQNETNQALDFFDKCYEQRLNAAAMNTLIAGCLQPNNSTTEYIIEKYINSSDKLTRDLAQEIKHWAELKAIPTNDEDKVKYLYINIKKIATEELINICDQINNKGLKLSASLYAQTELIQRKAFEEAEKIDLTGMNVAEMSYKANLNGLYILQNKNQYEKIKEILESIKLNTEDLPFKEYFKTVCYIKLHNDAKINNQIIKGLNALPLYTPMIELAINYYESNNDIDKAYKVAADAITKNNFNTTIKQKLCLLSIPKGLGSFVDKQLSELELELPKEKYAAFKKEFDEKASKQDEILTWE